MAKNVLKPPFHTAGPISRKVARARSTKKNIVSHQKGTLQHIFHLCTHPRRPRGSQSGREKRRDESFQVRAKELFARTSKLSSRPFSRPNCLPLGLRGWCTGHLSHSYFKRVFSLTSTPHGIGHFRVSKPLTFKTRPSWKPFLWKWVSFAWESMALHLASLWKGGLGQPKNSLLTGSYYCVKIKSCTNENPTSLPYGVHIQRTLLKSPLQDGDFGKTETYSWSQPFFTPFLWLSIRRTSVLV